MVTDDNRVKPILEWRTALTQLPDDVFLGLMRIYLGDIKTPFNKQTLLEQLGAFLRNQDHTDAICSFLDDADCCVITAVTLLSHPTFYHVSHILAGCIPDTKILGVIQSLEERLVLYRIMRGNAYELAINPYAADKIAAFARPELLFPALCGIEQTDEIEDLCNRDDVPFTGDLLLAGLFSAFYSGIDILKLDGTLKKKSLENIQRQFPNLFISVDDSDLVSQSSFPVSVEPAFVILFRGLLNLQLLQGDTEDVKANYRNWCTFSELHTQERFLYIAVAASGRKPQTELADDAALLLRFVTSLPPHGCSLKEAFRLLYVIREDQSVLEDGFKRGRVSRLSRLLDISVTQNQSPERAFQENFDSDAKMIAAAVSLGIIKLNHNRICSNESFCSLPAEPPDSMQGYAMLDPSGMLTILPGLQLAELLPIMQFVAVESIQTVGTFSLDKKSVSRGFSSGITADQIVATLECVSSLPVSQNIVFSLHDWFESYFQTMLYSGYVLCVTAEHRNLVEKNPVVKPYIAKILAPGIYLLSVTGEREAYTVLAAGGIDVPSIISCSPKKDTAASTPLPPVKSAEIFTVKKSSNSSVVVNQHEQNHAITEKLESLDVPKDLHDILQSLIQRRVVISPDQLTAGAVRFERNEARGVDFLGKVHLAETAANEGALLEVVYTENGTARTVCGQPVLHQKTTSDVFIRVYPDSGFVFSANTEKPVIISLARARSVKKISRSVFSGYGL